MNLTEISKETRIDHQEWLILQVSLHIEKLIQDRKISRAELSRRLGVNRAYITQLLDGSNLSLRKVADVLLALDASLVTNTAPLGFHTTLVPDADTTNSAVSHWGMAIAAEKKETFISQAEGDSYKVSKDALSEREKDLTQAA